jgi:hypothetical protein
LIKSLNFNELICNSTVSFLFYFVDFFGKRPLGRPRRRWVNNIKMALREIRWDGMDWIDLAHDRDQWRALVNVEMNLPVP